MPISKRECGEVAQDHPELVEASAAKRAKGDSGSGEKMAPVNQVADGPSDAGEKLQTFQVGLLGRSFEVSLPAASSVGDLLQKVREEPETGPYLYICCDGGEILDDPSAPLPGISQLTCIAENPAPLCPAALKVFKAVRPGPGNGEPEDLHRLHLGKCRKLGSFPTRRWKNDPRMAEMVDFHNFEIGRYNVVEMALIDGSGQLCRLLGVINVGDADGNFGFWGSVYLRPAFQEIGGLNDSGDTESTWDIKDDSWYVPHSSPPPRNEDSLMGGTNAKTPLETHLSHALATAFSAGYDEEE